MNTNHRAVIVQQIPMLATLMGREGGSVWARLYSDFAYDTGINFERMAVVNDCKQIDIIEREGLLAEFAEFVEKRMKEKTTPALPENEKAPGQGSLFGKEATT